MKEEEAWMDLSEQYQECDVDRLVTPDKTESAPVDAQAGAGETSSLTDNASADETPEAVTESYVGQKDEGKAQAQEDKAEEKAGEEDPEPEKKKATA
jgi:hypothetical protein